MTDGFVWLRSSSWESADYARLRETMEGMAEPSFQKFTSSLMPGVPGVLGVRLPLLRKLAGQIAKGNWKAYLEKALDDSYEETMLQGMVLGCAKGDLAEKRDCLERFIPKIDNWSTCDSFCAGLKLARTEPEAVWEFLQSYLHSEREYEIRFGVVMLLDYYIRSEYLQEVFRALEQIRHPAYYVRMAVAWALSMCYVTFPSETEDFLLQAKLDDWTRAKTLQKVIESRRIDEKAREKLKERRRELSSPDGI